MKKIILISIIWMQFTQTYCQNGNLKLSFGPLYTTQYIGNGSRSYMDVNLSGVQILADYHFNSAWTVGLSSGYNFNSRYNSIPLGLVLNRFYGIGMDTDGEGMAFYYGLNLGSGLVLNNSLNENLLYGGGQIGIQLMEDDSKYGYFLEVGYGKSIISGGIRFRP